MFTIQSAHVTFLIWGAIFCLVAGIIILNMKGTERKKKFFLAMLEFSVAWLLFNDTLAWLYRGAQGNFAYFIVRFSNFWTFFTSDLLALFFNSYIISYIFPGSALISDMINGRSVGRSKMPRRAYMAFAISVIGMMLVIVSQYTNLYYYIDENNIYHRTDLFPISMFFGIAPLLLDLTLLLKYRLRLRKDLFRALIFYIVTPLAAGIIAIFVYGISWINIAVAVAAVYLFIVVLKEHDMVMADMRTAILVSQIKPQFLYNTIESIQKDCYHKPEKASRYLGTFAVYLRGSLDVLGSKDCVSFAHEWNHTQNYIELEKYRNGEKLIFDINIQATHFNLPALTLQPLIENAISHGLLPKEEGGKVSIKTYRDNGYVFIEVEDDGVGFDFENYEGINRDNGAFNSSIGLNNVKSRLIEMCSGTLTIKSRPGHGTRAIVKIPDKGVD
ncbi:MAG: histidine kinase [Pseudobutyrivibrio sp.]|nr:histidine kinase [Pseudobutyrivibrio sp.]